MTLARNTTWILAGRLATQGLSVLVTILLARRLGLTGFAGYAVLASVVWLANVATTFGTDMVLVRGIAGGGPVGRWRAGLAVQSALSVAAIAVMWVAAPFLPWPSADGPDALRLYLLALLPLSAASIATAVLRGVGAMGRYAAVGVTAAATQLIAVLVLPNPSALADVAVVLLVAQVGAAALTWIVAAIQVPELRRAARVAGSDIVAMARASVPIGVLGLLGVLYQRGPILALAALSGPIGTAYVAAAGRIAEGSKAGHVALFSALFPVISALDAPAATLRWSWRASLAGSLGLAAALAILSPFAISLLYGPDFAPAATALAILALGIVPSTAATYRSLALVAAYREPVVLRALVAGLVALAVLVPVFVPAFGWAGACWGILAAEVVQLSAMFLGERESKPAPLAARLETAR
jgi:O-antigen/teichoic acid export membrane protein